MKMSLLQGHKDIWPEKKDESIESILNGIPSIFQLMLDTNSPYKKLPPLNWYQQ